MSSLTLASLTTRGINFFFPPLCASCGIPVQQAGNLCGQCWPKMTFITAPFCQCCGIALPENEKLARICGACITTPPEFDSARAVLKFDEAIRPLIHAFKYHDRQHLLPLFTRWLQAAGEPMLLAADVLVPVPLSRRRLFGRMFNQSALLARALAQQTSLTYAPLALVRTRHTPPQAGLSRAARQKNLRGAFEVPKIYRAMITGKKVVLVDDVVTTGATAEACAMALKKAGAARVDVLALARTE